MIALGMIQEYKHNTYNGLESHKQKRPPQSIRPWRAGRGEMIRRLVGATLPTSRDALTGLRGKMVRFLLRLPLRQKLPKYLA